MSEQTSEQTPTPGAAGAVEDPDAFPLDEWIDGVQRPERTVKLYPPNPAIEAEQERLVEQVRDLERAYAAAERRPPEERGITEESPATLVARMQDVEKDLAALRARWKATALAVRVRQLTPDEIKAAGLRAKEEEPDVGQDAILWAISEATIAPHFTPAQLRRLRARDVSGHAMVEQLERTVDQLSVRPTVPFSPASSTSPGGGTSSGS